VARPTTLNESAALDWDFFASVLRAVVDQSEMKFEIDKAYATGYREGREYAESRAKMNQRTDAERFKQEAEHYQRAIKTFEEKSGIKLTDWNAGNVGEIVKVLQEVRSPHHKRYLSGVCDQLQSAVDAMKAIYAFVVEMEGSGK
jgi:hypothetical protein